MRVPLEQRCLPVHGCGNKGDLRRHLELHRFRPHCVLGNLPGTPSLIEILEAWIAKSFFSMVDEQDVVLLQPSVVLLFPCPARTEITHQSTRALPLPNS